MSANKEVELKGGMYTFMSLRLHTSDLGIIDQRIAEKVQQAPGFFKDTPVVVDLTPLEDDIEQNGDLDAGSLFDKIRAHKLVPIVVSVSDKSSPFASSIELPLVEAGVRRQKKGSQSGSEGSTPDSSGKVGSNNSDGATRSNSNSTGAAASLISGPGRSSVATSGTEGSGSAGSSDVKEGQVEHSSELDLSQDLPLSAAEVQMVIKSPLLITRPVRSGQQVYARDTDLIITGQVGPGAEIIADNNIHVYGPLRGRALCGVSGNTKTRIFCQSLEAELVSVAGNFRLLEEIPSELRGKPAQIWLENDKLIIEPI